MAQCSVLPEKEQTGDTGLSEAHAEVKELMMQCNKHYKLGLKGWLSHKKQKGHYHGYILFQVE